MARLTMKLLFFNKGLYRTNHTDNRRIEHYYAIDSQEITQIFNRGFFVLVNPFGTKARKPLLSYYLLIA